MKQYVLNVAPTAKPRMTRRDKWAVRPATTKYWAFKDELRKQASDTGWELGEEIHVDFHVPMPKSWSKKKRAEMEGQPHRQRPDVDNYIKALLDSMLEEDSKVWKVQAAKYWSIDPKIIVYAR